MFLDELTHRLALQWLRHRHTRWPTTANPHLLITDRSAFTAGHPQVSRTTIVAILRPLSVQPSALRQDRILDEAAVTADPVHLMRLFGISAATAMRYIYTAHPERRSTPSH